MRRPVIYAAVILAGVTAAGAFWLAKRPMVVGRAQIGAPPPRLPQPETLVGQGAPEFDAVDQNGHQISSSALRGRIVVLNVWATWCRPCVEEMPRIEREIWRAFQPRVFVVGVARGEDPYKIREFGRKADLTFALVADPSGKIARSFGANHTIPQTFVIDRSGFVVYQTVGYAPRHFDRLVSAVQRAVDRK